jgi:GxxExxY protein
MFSLVCPQSSDALVKTVVEAAHEVHAALGHAAERQEYGDRLDAALRARGVKYRRSVWIADRYRGFRLSCGYRPDFIVEEKLVVQVLAAPNIEPDDEANLLHCLRLSGMRSGVVINFHVDDLARGIRGIEYGNILPEPPPEPATEGQP